MVSHWWLWQGLVCVHVTRERERDVRDVKGGDVLLVVRRPVLGCLGGLVGPAVDFAVL